MKTKASKILLAICIILAITNLFLAVGLSWKRIVPNRDKFELNHDEYVSFYGRDEVAIVGDGMYRVDYFGKDYYLYSGYAEQFILCNGVDYMFENSNLYFFAEDGYAVVYPESNLCKVYISPQQGNSPITKLEVTEEYPLNKLIVYLDSFDEYTDYEQKMLNKLVESHKADEKFWGTVESALMLPENVFKRIIGFSKEETVK